MITFKCTCKCMWGNGAYPFVSNAVTKWTLLSVGSIHFLVIFVVDKPRKNKGKWIARKDGD